MKLIRPSLVAVLALAAGPLAAQPAEPSRAILFERPHFQGRWITLFRDAPDLRPRSFDGHAASGHFDGAWTVCDAAAFAGHCLTVSGDVPDLGGAGLEGPVVSLRRGAGAAPVAAPQAADDEDEEGYFDNSVQPTPPAQTSASALLNR